MNVNARPVPSAKASLNVLNKNNPILVSNQATRAVDVAFRSMLDIISKLEASDEEKKKFIVMLNEIYLERKAKAFANAKMGMLSEMLENLFDLTLASPEKKSSGYRYYNFVRHTVKNE